MRTVKGLSAIGMTLVGALLLSAAPAAAQSTADKAGARAAADAGGDAFDAHRYAEAADLFERAERLVHAPPHLLWAARSHAMLGHLVEARELYLTLSREKLPSSAPRAFKDAQQNGEKELSDIEGRLPTVSVVVQGNSGGNTVRVVRNGETMPPELIGIPAPINPGQYSYQAFADDMQSSVSVVKLADGSHETVVLTLRTIPGAGKKKAPTAEQKSSGGVKGSLGDPPPSDAAEHGSGGRPYLYASLASFTVTAAGIGLGTYFMIGSTNSDKQASQLYVCNNTASCTPDDKSKINALQNDTTQKQALAITSYAVGGVGLAAGILFLVLDGKRSQVAENPRIVPQIGLNYVGMSGSF